MYAALVSRAMCTIELMIDRAVRGTGCHSAAERPSREALRADPGVSWIADTSRSPYVCHRMFRAVRTHMWSMPGAGKPGSLNIYMALM